MVRLAVVIAPVTGGANWLTSTMMVQWWFCAKRLPLAPGTSGSASRYRLRLDALELRNATRNVARGRSLRAQ